MPKSSSDYAKKLKTLHTNFVKIKISCSKRRLSGKVNEIGQNDVTNDVIDQKQDITLMKYIAKMFPRSRWTTLHLTYIS